MKKLYIALSLFLASFAYSQVPQAFSYQTIAFNSAGAPIANGNVNLRISILDNSATGTVLYTETHTKTTNSKGLVNLNIGQGTATTGNFGGINWGTNSKFVKVEMDPAGGNNYTNVGVNQLMSVPYALVADKVNMNSGSSSLNDDIVENKSSNFGFVDYSDDKIYVFNSKSNNWSTQSISASASADLIATNGNFGFVDYSGDKIYVFNSRRNGWSTQSISASASADLIATNGNFGFVDYSGDKIYVFNSKNNNWSIQPISASASANLIATNGNFGFVDYSDDKIYVFNIKSNSWSTQSISASASANLIATNGNFGFVDYSGDKIYIFNNVSGNWTSNSISGSASADLIISESN